MSKRRLIPKLQLQLVKYGKLEKLVLVTTVKFDKVIPVGDPVSQAKIYEAQSADELIFVCLDPSPNIRPLLISIARKISEEIFIPITIGGGVSTIEDFKELLRNGADKVSINTNAVLNPKLISEASAIYGAQCVVVSIDYKKDEDGQLYVYINGGETKTDLNPIDWAIKCAELGAGEILLTSIDRDGTTLGLDIDLIAQITNKISIPVIAAGGCGLSSHFIDGFINGGADAVSAGTFFSFKDQNPIQTRSHIKNAGVPIRVFS